MDYALSLCYGNASKFPRILTSTRPEMMINSKRSLTKPLDFLFRNKPSPPISQLSNFFFDTSKVLRWPQLGHHALISPVVPAHGRIVSSPSPADEEKGNGESTARIFSSMPATIRASFTLACILAIFHFGSTLMFSPNNAMACTPSTTTTSQEKQPQTSPTSGQHALSSFMDGVVYLGSGKFKPLPGRIIYREDVDKLRAEALEKMRKGYPTDAVNMMKQKYNQYIKEGAEGKYQFEMALVEILILQGKYKEALQYKCLEETKPADLRRALFKAIIYTMLDDKTATTSWNEFILGGFDGAFDPTQASPEK